jgi:arylsulfatase A-like enzyme
MFAVGLVVGLLCLAVEIAGLSFGSVSGTDLLRAAALHMLLGALAGLVLLGILCALRVSGRLLFTLATVLLLLLAGFFSQWNVRDRCDVLLIISDATRADHLSIHGYAFDTTPELVALEEECVIWDEMIAVGSSTIVSTPTILSSLYPTQHGLTGYLGVLADSVKTMALYLQDAGYGTYGHTTNPHLKTRQGFARGFDLYNEKGGWQTDAEQVFGIFLQWYLSQEKGRPLFGFLFLIDPHSPYAPPVEYRRLFDPDWEGTPISAARGMRWARGDVDERTKQNLVAQYDGEIAYFDYSLGGFLRALRQTGRLDEALVVYTSDHGEEFFEHGSCGHNKALYEESIWVPFVVRFPSPLRFPRVGPRGVRVPGLVSHVDILPTVLDFLHLPTERVPNGTSLLPMIGTREPDPKRWVYCEEILGAYGPYELYAIRTPEWKLIRTVIYEHETGRPDALYRLSDDPLELTNVFSQYPATAAQLAEMLESKLAVLRLGAPDSLQQVPVDDETMKSLRSLGYIK